VTTYVIVTAGAVCVSVAVATVVVVVEADAVTTDVACGMGYLAEQKEVAAEQPATSDARAA
jgi:hypothetical protein